MHWSNVGAPDAPDHELIRTAKAQGMIIVTQDLDFAQLLYATRESGPSVVLLRTANEFDPEIRQRVCDSIRRAAPDLSHGALLTVSQNHARLRKLPIQP